MFVPLKEFTQHPHFGKGESPKPLLFEVVKDKDSSRDLAVGYPEVVRKMMDLAEKAREDLRDLSRAGATQRKPGKIENPVPVTMDTF